MSWSWRDEHDDFDFDKSPDCSKCIHRIPFDSKESGCKKGCSAWECSFEERPPMSLEEAIEILKNIDWSKADEGKDEMQVEEEDRAFDLVIAKAKAYMNRDCAEWNDWIDGHLGVKTDAGTCSKCGSYNNYKTTFCPHCGRQMKNVRKKGETI